ncbi:MAG: hypothetical protein AB1349_00040 [Elusimicrobiota bacterium]
MQIQSENGLQITSAIKRLSNLAIRQLRNSVERREVRSWFSVRYPLASIRYLLFAICYSLFAICCLYSQTTISYPIYLCATNNPNDYRLFANGGGWDGFWYVGYNRVWIEQIVVPEDMSNYKKVFVGAKLGRMKSRQVYVNGKPTLDKEAIPGDIYIAVSSTPVWKETNWKFLTATSDIPFEGDSELAIEHVGESRWFWTPIPLNELNFGGENYIALWSTSASLTDSSNSPIIAAAWGGKETNSFINDEIKGNPPQYYSTTTLKSPITVFEPAIALKFVPEVSQNITLHLMGITDNEKITEKKNIYASVLGNEIEKAWLEISSDKKNWTQHGFIVYTAPYMFSLNPKKLPQHLQSTLYLRVCATDIWENTNTSQPVKIFISQ